jgi:hypothetical protein
LDRCGNKPFLFAESLSTYTNPLPESSNLPETALPCCQYSYSFPTDCMSTWLLPLPAASLSVNIAVQKQLTFVHDRFLERGQEVSHDLFLMSRRNFSLKLGGSR